MHRVSSRFLRQTCARLCVVLAAGAAGCKSWTIEDIPGITPYRIEIQQGNFVSQDMLSKLKKGMSRDQVRFVLGTPLLTDMFHADRWDYVFYREFPNKTREERRISVFFENERLARVTGDVVPETEAASRPAPKSAVTTDAASGTASAPEAAAQDAAAKDEAVKDEAKKDAAANDGTPDNDAASLSFERAGEQGQ